MKVPELLKFPLTAKQICTNSIEVHGCDGCVVFEFYSGNDDMKPEEIETAEWVVKALNEVVDGEGQ